MGDDKQHNIFYILLPLLNCGKEVTARTHTPFAIAHPCTGVHSAILFVIIAVGGQASLPCLV